ncbi:tyrosine-type recombinase/integrase [Ensifer sp. LC163]|uniref:tyrosine-type recombinase/integrase n=1 Tax=Ensifer sp. LC163 TaxID=1120652 RepID=UPI000812E173|nr:tyrosine-type recombinase/integrase [Ensifer sp. LC163]OCP36769.1 integrase [Ensifer sp. LC163]
MPLKISRHDNGVYYVSGTVTVWRDGKPHPIEVRRSTKSRDAEQADAIKRQIENEVAERNITGKEPAVTFRQAAKRYVDHGGEARFLQASKDGMFELHSRFNRFAKKPVDEITQELIDDEGLKAYPNPATRRRQFHAPVIAVLRKSGVKQQFERPEDSQKRTDFLRPVQAVQILGRIMDARYPNPWAPAFVTFLFGQGSRVSETLSIDGRDDISLEHRYAILRDTKSGKERLVNLCPRVIAACSTLPNIGEPGPLFLRYDGRPYTKKKDTGYRFGFWSRAVTESGLDPETYTPHTARHSWATWFYSQTKDVVRLKAEGGWDSSEWERYVKLAAPSLGAEAIKHSFDFRHFQESDGRNKKSANRRFQR